MAIGKLCTIGDSAGTVIHQQNLQQLGWFKGDQLQQKVVGNTLVITNLTERAVRPVQKRKDYGNGFTRSARRPR